jgi:hypothetical protein
MDAADVLQKRWDGETHESVEPGQAEDPEFLRHLARTLAPFSRDQFPGLATGEDAVLGPEQLGQTLGSLGARRLGLVPADRPADVLPLIGWTPSDQSGALTETADTALASAASAGTFSRQSRDLTAAGGDTSLGMPPVSASSFVLIMTRSIHHRLRVWPPRVLPAVANGWAEPSRVRPAEPHIPTK